MRADVVTRPTTLDGSPRCKHVTWSGYHYLQCKRRAKYDGFCGTHEPGRVQARKDKKDAEREARYQAHKAVWAAREAADRELGRRGELFMPLVGALEALLMEPNSADARDRAHQVIKQAKGEA